MDQFSFSRNDTFKMRVLYNEQYFDVSDPGPVFFYTGNEGDIEMFANNTGLLCGPTCFWHREQSGTALELVRRSSLNGALAFTALQFVCVLACSTL